MTPKLHCFPLLLCLIGASPACVLAQSSNWKGMGVSTGAPLPPAENFPPRPHGPELTKAGLKSEVIAKLDVEMQRHVAAKNVAGSYGWGDADGTQFVVDRSKRTYTLFMVQTQHYKAPTYPAFLALVNEACGLTVPGAMTGTPTPPGGTSGGMSSPFKQRDTNGDGKPTRDELPAALFDRPDADKDGAVTEAELTTLWKR